MNWLEPLSGLAGGLGLFIFGMQLCSEGLQKVAARRLKKIVKTLTANRMLSLLVGMIVTLGLQSSSATSALVVGFISSGMLKLSQALGILLGSALGASLTAQLIAFKIVGLAQGLIFIGAFFYLFAKRLRHKNIGQSVLGFGLIFLGMQAMTAAMLPVRDEPMVAATLIQLEHYPFLEFLVGMLGTALIQSSPAFLALLMTLATNHLVGSWAIVPLVLGAHVGGTVTGVLSSLGAAGIEAKQAAWANFGFKLLIALLFLPFYQPLTKLILTTATDYGRIIANTHTFFSLMMIIIFLPFTKKVAELMKYILPQREVEFGAAKYLDENLLKVPELAVDQAYRQTLEMGQLVKHEMLDLVLKALHEQNEELIVKIQANDRAIDTLYRKISRYVTSLGDNPLPDELMQKVIRILYAANDFEHVGDVAVKVAQLAQKVRSEELQFSEEGFEELAMMYQHALANFCLVLKAFETSDKCLATKVIKEHPKMQRLEKELRYSHFERMQAGNEKAAATSAVHLDLIEASLRIDHHAVNIAQVVMGIV